MTTLNPDIIKGGWIYVVEATHLFGKMERKILRKEGTHSGVCGGGFDIVQAEFCGVRPNDIRIYSRYKIHFYSIIGMSSEDRWKFAWFAATTIGKRYGFLQLLFILIHSKTKKFDTALEWLNKFLALPICSSVPLDAALRLGYNLIEGIKTLEGKIPAFCFAPHHLMSKYNHMTKEEYCYEP